MRIRVVYKEPYKPAEIREVENSLETYQELVGGYIEAVSGAFPPPLCIYINEEGKVLGLEPNFILPFDVIHGPLVVVSTDSQGNTVGLDEDEALGVKLLLDTFSYKEAVQ